MLAPIKYIKVDKIIDEITTKGSGPLRVLGDDGFVYYAKSTSYGTKHELINEIICSYLAKLWGFSSPDIVLLQFDKVVVDEFIKSGSVFSDRYKNETFEDYFFGSQEVKNQVEIESYFNSIPTKADFNFFASPLDIIRISVFDIWLCNKDRKPENPNILLSISDGKFNFVPIDHVAVFGYSSDYNSLRPILLFLEDKFRIINVAFTRSIVKFADNNNIVELEQEIIGSIENCLSNLDFIFAQVPSTWGFSKNAKRKLIEILSNKDRNIETSKAYLAYMK